MVFHLVLLQVHKIGKGIKVFEDETDSDVREIISVEINIIENLSEGNYR